MNKQLISLIAGIMTICCNQLTTAKDQYFHTDCFLNPRHAHTGQPITDNMKKAFTQAVNNTQVQESLAQCVNTMLDNFQWIFSQVALMDKKITNECKDALAKAIPTMKNGNPIEIVGKTCKAVLKWHPLFVKTLLSIKDTIAPVVLETFFAWLPFYETFIQEIKKQLTAHEIASLTIR